MQWLWLFVVVPLYNLWQALSQAWLLLQRASSAEERQAIIDRAAVQALINTVMAFVVGLAPFPYNLLGLIPSVLQVIGKMLGIAIHVTLMHKGRRL